MTYSFPDLFPIPLFCNYPSLPISFVKVLPSITPDQVSSNIFANHVGNVILLVRHKYEAETLLPSQK